MAGRGAAVAAAFILAMGVCVCPAFAASLAQSARQVPSTATVPTQLPAGPARTSRSDSTDPATTTEEGENADLATLLLLLIFAAGVLYGGVKLLQRRAATGAQILPFPRLRSRGQRDEDRSDELPPPRSQSSQEQSPTPTRRS